MRLPMKNDEVDYDEFNRMIDAFIGAGFNYFDTAHGYLDGKSETAIRDCLAARYPRDAFILANKLTHPYFETAEDVRPFFESQLELCGVEYFDFYLFHCLNATNYQKHKACKTFETVKQLKAEGKVRHIAMSFHDTADVLDMILSENDCIEAVQLQINYLDYDDPGVQSKKCYDVAVKHGKKVIVMEPVKGGSLVNRPDDAKAVLDALEGGSYASYAIRFAASFDGIKMVLSGMGDMNMMNDNLSYMKDFKPLDERERKAIDKVCAILRGKGLIACTGCSYCTEGCPKQIPIPNLFACMNDKRIWQNWNSDYYYGIHTKDKGKASDCIGCGKCEKICPQGLPIRELLKQVAEEFEKEK
jgi:predicted aldo/keto reductase-like oxidoreductase